LWRQSRGLPDVGDAAPQDGGDAQHV
jgi:hypothetical protein